MTRLQVDNLTDFTGGLNLRAGELYLAGNESPQMLNVDVDPRGGFALRKGWGRWNTSNVVSPASWDPRAAQLHALSDGGFEVYVANGTTLYASSATASFSDLGVTVGASPHLADFALWGDTAYIACGRSNASHKREGAGAASSLSDPSITGYDDDYVAGGSGKMPKADLAVAHTGYLFVASITENGVDNQNRIRWSHPDNPEAWATNDFLDINIGGGRITALLSFRDHLLIFKPDSVWALYGYNLQSWQLIQVSRSVGAPTPQAVTRSDQAAFFFSDAGRNGVYAYTDQEPTLISESLDVAMEGVQRPNDVWVGFADRRLYCSVPWTVSEQGSTSDGTLFVFDPYIGGGAWTAVAPARGHIRKVLEASDIADERPIAIHAGVTDSATLVQFEAQDEARDYLVDSNSPELFAAEYWTGWQTAGYPERNKSWLRPRYLTQALQGTAEVQLDVFHNFDSTSSRRSYVLSISAGGEIFWRETGALESGGFDWDELGEGDPDGLGANWGGASGSTEISRVPRNLGLARSIQLCFSVPSATTATGRWAVDAIFLKYVMRRLTT